MISKFGEVLLAHYNCQCHASPLSDEEYVDHFEGELAKAGLEIRDTSDA